MFAHVVAWYAKRIVNVNINIILAGVLALIPMLGVVRVAEYLLSSGLLKNEKLQTHHKLVITGVTFVADVVFDVTIYFVLHWVAHHAPRRIKAKVEHRIEGVADAAAEHVPFFKDAAKIQIQRALLSPLLYLLFLGTQFVLMSNYDISAAWATVIGLGIGMGVVRSIHTFWMLKEERSRRAITEGRVCGKCSCDLRAVPCEGSGACPECGKPFTRPVVAKPPAPVLATKNGPSNGAPQSRSEKGEKSVSRS